MYDWALSPKGIVALVASLMDRNGKPTIGRKASSDQRNVSTR